MGVLIAEMAPCYEEEGCGGHMPSGPILSGGMPSETGFLGAQSA